jgi:microtubule-associated protein, RP/EB family
MANENFGMMDGAFFVPKSELISWVNNLLSLNITKVEQMASGAAYCQIMDVMYPGCIAMSKINWGAKFEHEFVNNYKLLQQAFDKNMVHKHIEVEKLIKAKYQDNLEFLQWFKRFFDLNCRGGADYQAVERRKGVKTPWDGGDRKGDVRPAKVIERVPEKAKGISAPKPQSKAKPQAQGENVDKQVAELRMNCDTLEKERDFYFAKLRSIEIYCDHFDGQDNPIITDLQKILFATDDEEVTVNEDGTVSVSQTTQE